MQKTSLLLFAFLWKCLFGADTWLPWSIGSTLSGTEWGDLLGNRLGNNQWGNQFRNPLGNSWLSLDKPAVVSQPRNGNDPIGIENKHHSCSVITSFQILTALDSYNLLDYTNCSLRCQAFQEWMQFKQAYINSTLSHLKYNTIQSTHQRLLPLLRSHITETELNMGDVFLNFIDQS